MRFYSCLSRCVGVLAMLLPLFSLQWWRCQLIPSSSHSARILKNTKGQPNMRRPFSLKLLMTKMRCRDSLKVPIKVSHCIILFTFQNSRSFIYCKVLLFLRFSPKFSFSLYMLHYQRKAWGKGCLWWIFAKSMDQNTRNWWKGVFANSTKVHSILYGVLSTGFIFRKLVCQRLIPPTKLGRTTSEMLSIIPHL